ncbi:ATP-binding protein, partial [Burkholderia sp. SIMBA_024]
MAEALTIPAAHEDASWDDDAVDVVVTASGRYPYFIQQYGQDTWNAAPGSAITARDAEIGVLQGNNQLDSGFFRVRWDRATPSEQQYLRAMAADGDEGSSSGEIATRLGKKPKS